MNRREGGGGGAGVTHENENQNTRDSSGNMCGDSSTNKIFHLKNYQWLHKTSTANTQMYTRDIDIRKSFCVVLIE